MVNVSKQSITLAQRATGCLLGLAVGDAFGDIGRSDPYRQRYGIVTNLYEGAKSTDDTEFAVLTGQMLLDCDGDLTSEQVVAGWRKYIIDEGGVGNRGGKPQYGAVANLERGVLPPYSGLDNVQNNDDGAAMRVAPIGILCAGDVARANDSRRLMLRLVMLRMVFGGRRRWRQVSRWRWSERVSMKLSQAGLVMYPKG